MGRLNTIMARVERRPFRNRVERVIFRFTELIEKTYGVKTLCEGEVLHECPPGFVHYTI